MVSWFNSWRGSRENVPSSPAAPSSTRLIRLETEFTISPFIFNASHPGSRQIKYGAIWEIAICYHAQQEQRFFGENPQTGSTTPKRLQTIAEQVRRIATFILSPQRRCRRKSPAPTAQACQSSSARTST